MTNDEHLSQAKKFRLLCVSFTIVHLCYKRVLQCSWSTHKSNQFMMTMAAALYLFTWLNKNSRSVAQFNPSPPRPPAPPPPIKRTAFHFSTPESRGWAETEKKAKCNVRLLPKAVNYVPPDWGDRSSVNAGFSRLEMEWTAIYQLSNWNCAFAFVHTRFRQSPFQNSNQQVGPNSQNFLSKT